MFKVVKSVCENKRMVDLHTQKKDYTPEPGELLGTVYKRKADDPLPPMPPTHEGR